MMMINPNAMICIVESLIRNLIKILTPKGQYIIHQYNLFVNTTDAISNSTKSRQQAIATHCTTYTNLLIVEQATLVPQLIRR